MKSFLQKILHPRLLRVAHLYLSCIFAPMLVFFALTGAWQLFNFYPRGTKPPFWISALTNIHRHQTITRSHDAHPFVLKCFFCAGAIGLILTTIIGVIMAYRFTHRPIAISILLILGIALPIGFLYFLK